MSNIAAAIAHVSQAIPELEKAKHSDQLQYEYLSMEQVMGAVKGPMAEAGIAIVQLGVGATTMHTITTRNGEAIIAEFDISFKLLWEDEECIMTTKASSFVTDDKWASKAITSAWKNLLIQLFLIEARDGQPAYNPLSTSSSPTAEKPWLNPGTDAWQQAVKELKAGTGLANIKRKYKLSRDNENKLTWEGSQPA